MMVVLPFLFFISATFPDILTQKELCKQEAKKIDINNINSPDESVKNFFILLCAGDRQKAKELLEKSDEKFPNNFVIKYNLGNFYIEEGRYDFAVFYLNQARKINPIPQVFESIAVAYTYRGDLKSAKDVLDKAIQEFEKKADPKIILQLLIKKGFISLLLQDLKDAKKSFRKAIAIDQTNPYAYLGLAEVLSRKDRMKSAVEAISRIQNLTDDPVLHLYSAVLLHSKGYLEQATSYYISAAEKFTSPLRYVSKALLSAAQRDLGMYIESRENFEYVLKDYPGMSTVKLPFFPERRLKLALDFMKKGNIKGAEAEIREILKLSPENPEAQKILVELLLMKSLLFSGKKEKIDNLEEAREIAKKYIDKNPSDDEMLYRFALINFWLAEVGSRVARSGNLMHAISALQSAIKLKEKSEYIELLGLCYYALEKYDDAIAEFKKIKPRKREIDLLLASAYLKIGDVKKARKVLEKISTKKDMIFALISYNIAKAMNLPNTEKIAEAIIEGKYENISLDQERKQKSGQKRKMKNKRRRR